jgi:hypothetical protein
MTDYGVIEIEEYTLDVPPRVARHRFRAQRLDKFFGGLPIADQQRETVAQPPYHTRVFLMLERLPPALYTLISIHPNKSAALRACERARQDRPDRTGARVGDQS